MRKTTLKDIYTSRTAPGLRRTRGDATAALKQLHGEFRAGKGSKPIAIPRSKPVKPVDVKPQRKGLL
jgi:hypothetical protein